MPTTITTSPRRRTTTTAVTVAPARGTRVMQARTVVRGRATKAARMRGTRTRARRGKGKNMTPAVNQCDQIATTLYLQYLAIYYNKICPKTYYIRAMP